MQVGNVSGLSNLQLLSEACCEIDSLPPDTALSKVHEVAQNILSCSHTEIFQEKTPIFQFFAERAKNLDSGAPYRVFRLLMKDLGERASQCKSREAFLTHKRLYEENVLRHFSEGAFSCLFQAFQEVKFETVATSELEKLFDHIVSEFPMIRRERKLEILSLVEKSIEKRWKGAKSLEKLLEDYSSVASFLDRLSMKRIHEKEALIQEDDFEVCSRFIMNQFNGAFRKLFEEEARKQEPMFQEAYTELKGEVAKEVSVQSIDPENYLQECLQGFVSLHNYMYQWISRIDLLLKSDLSEETRVVLEMKKQHAEKLLQKVDFSRINLKAHSLQRIKPELEDAKVYMRSIEKETTFNWAFTGMFSLVPFIMNKVLDPFSSSVFSLASDTVCLALPIIKYGRYLLTKVPLSISSCYRGHKKIRYKVAYDLLDRIHFSEIVTGQKIHKS